MNSDVNPSQDSTPPPESSPPESSTQASSGTASTEAQRMSEEAQRVQDMLSEGGGVVQPNVPVSEEESPRPESDVARPQRKFLGWLEDFSHKWGAARLKTLVEKKGRVSESMGSVPQNMHRVASQTRLVLELIDDFRDGTYREVSWRSIALLVAGLLYAVSPG